MNWSTRSWIVGGSVVLALVLLAHELYFWPNESKLIALDVGQGDAILLTTPESHVILVDGGPGQQVLSELAKELPFVWRDLDLIVLTHPHADHLEGLLAVLDRYHVQAVLMSAPNYSGPAYEAWIQKIEDQKIPLYFAEAGTDFEFGSLYLDVLYPFTPIVGQQESNINNVSVVIKAIFKGGSNGLWSVLLTGDAEKEVEVALLEEQQSGKITLLADGLKAGHHGSKTSSSPEFVAAVAPDWMLISCGRANVYGHPDAETLATAAIQNIPVYRTDLEGSIEFAPP